jgi:hypothetical protein
VALDDGKGAAMRLDGSEWLMGSLIILAINLVVGFFIARAAQRKGRSFVGFLALSTFIGWVIPFIIVLVMAPQRKLPIVESGPQMKCPDCIQLIPVQARVCKHCGKHLLEIE